MGLINRMAEFIGSISFEDLSLETIENIKMHILDTIGAWLGGIKTREGIAIGRLLKHFPTKGNVPIIGFKYRSSLLTAIMVGCSVTRCTEVDDIHLKSCTTPGSVIVPTVLSFANAGYIKNTKEFIVASVIGYEFIIRFGLAIDGPNVLYNGIWPTYFVAPFGSAAVAAKIMKLNVRQISGTLSTALTLSSGIEGKINRDALFTRWLTLGIAAQNGVIATFAAQKGFEGDEKLLDEENKYFSGLKLYHKKLINNLGKNFMINETSMKPYSVARQGLSAVEAFREIISDHNIDLKSIKKIDVYVPKRFIKRIDHAVVPDNRLKTIPNVRYLMALAIIDPDRLFDLYRRDSIKNREKIKDIMGKIHIKESKELELYYPESWPAKVIVETDSKKYPCTMLHPKGDWCNRLNWEDVIKKFKRLTKSILKGRKRDKLIEMIKNIEDVQINQILKQFD